VPKSLRGAAQGERAFELAFPSGNARAAFQNSGDTSLVAQVCTDFKCLLKQPVCGPRFVLLEGKQTEIRQGSSQSPSIVNAPEDIHGFLVKTPGLRELPLIASYVAEVVERPANRALISDLTKK
jgi:hypothetical protein